MYSDKTLTCADCGQEFVFTASEQDFYAQRGFTEPRRCASCRASRKAARNTSLPAVPAQALEQAAVVRKLIELGHVKAGHRLQGHDRAGRATGHVATLQSDGTVLLDDDRVAPDLDAAGRLVQRTRACDGWTFWWVEQDRTGMTSLEAIRQGALAVGEI